MAGTATALVLVGEHSVGPFGARSWRPRHAVTLIEKHRPCWVVSEVGFGVGPGFVPTVTYLPRDSGITTELLTVLACCVVDDQTYLQRLQELGLATPDPHEPGLLRLDVPEELDDTVLPPDLEAFAAELLTDRLRLGVVRLESSSLMDDAAVLRLRALGFDVDDFHAVPATSTRNFLD